LRKKDNWSWYDLAEFCDDMGCSYFENLYDGDQVESYIDEVLSDKARHDSWRDVRDWLNSMPDNCNGDYYRLDDYGEFVEMDDYDFRELCDEIISYADERDLWEEEEVEEEITEEEEIEEEDLTPIEEEAIPLSDLIKTCGEGLKFISDNLAKEERDFDNSIVEIVGSFKVAVG